MDLATLIGLIGALAIIVASILLGASRQIFFNVPSLLIVVVGSFFVVMAKFSLGQFIGAFKVAARAFKFRLPSVEESIAELVDIAALAEIEDIAIVAGPGSAALATSDDCQAVRDALISHCETLRYRFAILAGPRDADQSLIREVRGRGLLIGMELDTRRVNARTAAEWLLARGLMTKDTHDSVLRFAPPLIVGEPELEWAAEVIEDALADLATRFPGAQA